MIIAHLADTHLGCIGTGWQRTVPDPFALGIAIRQQEADIRQGLAAAVDRIISLKPDLVIHAGDLFDHAHPTPSAVQFAFSQLRRLSDIRIPVVVVEGDHSAPRMPAQGEPLQILANIPGVQVACGGHAKVLEVGDTIVYALPHRALLSEAEVKRATDPESSSSPAFRVLVSHGVADGLPFYQTNRSAASVPVRRVAGGFDYVALGHCHRFCQVTGTDRAFYAGSTGAALPSDFRTGLTFGFNLVTLSQGGAPLVTRETVGTRTVREYGLSDAQRCSASDIMDFLRQQIEVSPAEDAFCRVVIAEIDPAVRSQLAIREIEQLFPDDIAGLSIQTHVRVATQAEHATGTGSTPRDRFVEKVWQTDVDETMRSEILALGGTFFDHADAEIRTEDQEAV